KCSLRVTLTLGIPLLPAMNPDSGPARIVARDMAQGKTISDKEGGTREEPARAGAGRLNRCTGGNFLEPSRKRLVTSPGAPPSSREACRPARKPAPKGVAVGPKIGPPAHRPSTRIIAVSPSAVNVLRALK